MGAATGFRGPGGVAVSTFTDHFAVAGEALGPQPWMQLRLVASDEAEAVSRSYDTVGGFNKSELLQELLVSWTNDTPITQSVYGLVTRGGSQVTLQARSRGYLSMGHAVDFITGDGAPSFDLVEVSKGGVGSDLGNSGLLALGGAFGISELRQNSVTMPFMPHLTGWWTVAPGDTIHGIVQVYFVSEFWENTILDGGDSDTESRVVAGDLRLDIFAVPTPEPTPVAAIPTLVGSVTHDTEIDLTIADTRTQVNLPEGLAEGDTLIAVVGNQLGFISEITPVEDGWTLLHERDAGWQDVHLRIFIRTVSDDEPEEYQFENSGFAEEIAMLIGLRDVQPYDPILNNWHVASKLSRWKLVEDHIAPSINRRGQLLLAVSYFAHGINSPITHTPPAGMTEIADVPGTVSAMSAAMLSSPPRPTLDREFALSTNPLFSGHSIAVSILVPGEIT